MHPTPIDLTDLSRIALGRMLETGDVVGRDALGRTVITVAVEDWMFDWLMPHGSEDEDLEPEPIEDDDGSYGTGSRFGSHERAFGGAGQATGRGRT